MLINKISQSILLTDLMLFKYHDIDQRQKLKLCFSFCYMIKVFKGFFEKIGILFLYQKTKQYYEFRSTTNSVSLLN